MKKSLLSLAVLSAISIGAYADGVELYGVLDVAVGTVSHQFNGDAQFPATINTTSQTYAQQTLTGMFNGGIQDSRWGIKGTEEIGDGLKAVFVLESGIDLNTGALNNASAAIAANNSGSVSNASASSLDGQLFNRQAWVGLSDAEMGQLTFGRQYAPMYDIYSTYDPVQFAQLFSPLGFSGTIGGGGGATELMRQDNSIKFSNKFGDFNYGAMYKFGNVAGSTSNGQAYAFRLGYESGRFGVQAAYQAATDAVTASADGQLNSDGSVKGTITSNSGVNVTEQNMNAVLIAAKYKFNDEVTGKVGYQRYTLSTASDPLKASQITANSYFGYPIYYVTQIGGDRSVNITDIGGDYKITPKTNIAIGYYVVNYDAYSAGNLVTLNTPTGTGSYAPSVAAKASASMTYVSALLDYNFSKRTDVYAGYMSTQPGGAFAAYANNSIFAFGMRHKF